MENRVSTFGDRFAELCRISNKTTSELVNEIHVSNQTISAWKSGERKPKDLTVKAVAAFFRVSEKWLKGYDVPMKDEKPSKVRYLATLADELSEEQLDAVITIAEGIVNKR